jgi:hypothetical protein
MVTTFNESPWCASLRLRVLFSDDILSRELLLNNLKAILRLNKSNALSETGSV